MKERERNRYRERERERITEIVKRLAMQSQVEFKGTDTGRNSIPPSVDNGCLSSRERRGR